MTVVSRLIVVSPTTLLSESVRFAFERDGSEIVQLDDIPALLHHMVAVRAEPKGSRPVLCVVAADDAKKALELTNACAEALGEWPSRRSENGKINRDHGDGGGAKDKNASTSVAVTPLMMPLLCIGPATLDIEAIRAAGADEVLVAPIMARDVSTLGKLLVAATHATEEYASGSSHGQLSDYGSVYYLARAIAVRGCSAVLSMVRGLRRGELRFYQGEITSAQVGALHGLAALHQLLLWSRAHIELRLESVIPRRQIPLPANEILADAERFLREMRAVLGPLVPATVYEIIPACVKPYENDIPAAVYKIILLLDGYRTMADVVEDSPYRVQETIRIARRLCELGWIEPSAGVVDETRPLEERLADELAEFSNARIGTVELEPIADRPITPVPGLADALFDDTEDRSDSSASESATSAGNAGGSDERVPIDWSDVLPTEFITGFSPVVPSTAAAGEIGSGGAVPPPATSESKPAPAPPAAPRRIETLPPPPRAQPRRAPTAGSGEVELAMPPAPRSNGSGQTRPDTASHSSTATSREPSSDASTAASGDAAADSDNESSDDPTLPKPVGKKRLRSL